MFPHFVPSRCEGVGFLAPLRNYSCHAIVQKVLTYWKVPNKCAGCGVLPSKGGALTRVHWLTPVRQRRNSIWATPRLNVVRLRVYRRRDACLADWSALPSGESCKRITALRHRFDPIDIRTAIENVGERGCLRESRSAPQCIDICWPNKRGYLGSMPISKSSSGLRCPAFHVKTNHLGQRRVPPPLPAL